MMKTTTFLRQSIDLADQVSKNPVSPGFVQKRMSSNRSTAFSKLSAVILLILFAWPASLSWADEPRGEEGSIQDAQTLNPRILMIGNSYTYYNDLGTKLLRLMELVGRQPDIVTVADGGLRFDDHRQLGSLRTAPGPWDFVVLQGQSRMPIRYPQKMAMHAGALISEVEKMGAEPVFFMTWPRFGRFKDGERVASVYRKLAKAHDARLAPIGLAFEAARVTQPELYPRLYDPDGSHPADTGSWLAAMVIFETVTELDVRTLKGFEHLEGLDTVTFQNLTELAHSAVEGLNRLKN